MVRRDTSRTICLSSATCRSLGPIACGNGGDLMRHRPKRPSGQAFLLSTGRAAAALPSPPDSGLKTPRAQGFNPAPGAKDAQQARPFFMCTEPDAQTYRHQVDPDHRRRTHRHRTGLRIRLFRHPGLQGPQGRGLSDRPGQFEPGDDHDRSGSRRRHLYRTDHAGNRRQDHREGAARRAAPDHGRTDRAQLRAVAQEAWARSTSSTCR